EESLCAWAKKPRTESIDKRNKGFIRISICAKVYYYLNIYSFVIADKLRCMPCHLLRFRGEFLNVLRKASSVICCHSAVDRFSISGMGVKACSLCGFEKRFQGHMSWHI